MPPLGLEVCDGHPDLPFTVRTRDGFPDFDGGNLLVFVDYVFEFRAEPASRHGGLRAGSAEAALRPFEVIFHVGAPTTFVQEFYARAFPSPKDPPSTDTMRLPAAAIQSEPFVSAGTDDTAMVTNGAPTHASASREHA